MSWFADFFGALPDALRALYEFGDPGGLGRGWWGFVILAIWGIGLTAVPLYLARRWYGQHEWASATMGVLGGFSILWWVYGVLPSAWVLYVDSNKELLEGAIIPASMTLPNPFGEGRLDIATNLYAVIRDTVVVLEHGVAFVATFWAAQKIQEKYPRTLAPGEEKSGAGGYR